MVRFAGLGWTQVGGDSNRVTIHVVPNLPLTSKLKFNVSMSPVYKNATFVLVSMGGLTKPEGHPVIIFHKGCELSCFDSCFCAPYVLYMY